MNIISPYNYNNIPVPRVTEILSKTIHEDYIVKWANYLGFKHLNYQDELDKYANIGTITHERISQILLGDSLRENDIAPVQSFCIWYNGVKSNNDVKTIYSEKTLVCSRYGGTLDALLEINGKSYLIDFKTSNQLGFKYYLQLAAYRRMLFEVYGYVCDGCILLRLDKKTGKYQEVILDLCNYNDLEFMNDCDRAFVSLVYAYYNRVNIETNSSYVG